MKRSGFTLIEMIVTILVVSIMFLAIAGFLELGTKGYADSAKRQALQNQARFALEKMSREIRHAVPNSLSVSANKQCLTFYPILYSGFYNVDSTTISGGEDTIRFVVGNDNPDVLGAAANGARLTINPSRIEDLDTSNSGSISIVGVAQSGSVYSIPASFPSYSVGKRHYIYQPADKVDYCFEPSSQFIWVCRGLSSTEDCASLVNTQGVKIGEKATSGAFQYEDPSLIRGGIVHIDMTYKNDDEVSEYKHDVQVLNVP
ncbi:type II secretion system protein [Vibrio tapetis subsp. quintayensis]|uniref:PilW family protein n=1 Tax=Vibrio tapetis TaxID=52443 RepID=UPI0025B59628|nr:type II secretion system protein [Vibrio tapetis]MDN3680408.1 type II secretion system protein [Vibrio tapetis subsp. quintayensis]